jgi:hypothetical protein
MRPIEPIQYAQICADAVLAERERIIQVLLRTDPVALEDRNHKRNPFSSHFLAFMESALRDALKP